MLGLGSKDQREMPRVNELLKNTTCKRDSLAESLWYDSVVQSGPLMDVFCKKGMVWTCHFFVCDSFSKWEV